MRSLRVIGDEKFKMEMNYGHNDYIIVNGELYHSGVKGMKWGVRNYQYEDGSYKPGAEGRYAQGGGGVYGINYRHYSKKADRLAKRRQRNSTMASMNRAAGKRSKSKLGKKIYSINESHYQKKSDKLKKREDVNRTMASMNLNAAEEQRKKRESRGKKAAEKAMLRKR